MSTNAPSALYCNQKCLPSTKLHAVKFTLTANDLNPAYPTVKAYIDEQYGKSKIQSFVNKPFLSQPSLSNATCINDTTWHIVANLIFAPLYIDPIARLCNPVGKYVDDGYEIRFNIAPPPGTLNPKVLAINKPEITELNRASSDCLGKWIKGFLDQYNGKDGNTEGSVYYRNSVNNIIECTGVKLNSFTPIINHNVEKYTNSSHKLPSNIMIKNVVLENMENFSDISNNPGITVIDNPNTFWEYLFMFAYFFSFIGAIFYGVTYIINVDPTHIITNKTASLAINIYISLCSVISLFVWFNAENPFLDKTMLNPNSVKYIIN